MWGCLTLSRLWLLTSLLSIALYAPLLFSLLAQVPPSGEWANDFTLLWAAAKFAWQGQPALAYDAAALTASVPALATAPVQPSFYPPLYLLLTAPLGALEYPVAYVVFVLPSLIALTVAAAAIFRAQAALAVVLVLCFGGFWQLLHYGQNSGWIAILYLLVYAGLRAGHSGAGIALGLIAVKPHLGLLAPLHLVSTRRWSVFVAAALTVLALTVLSGWLFGWDVWWAYTQVAGYPVHRLLDFTMPNQDAPISLYAGLRRWGMGATEALLCQAALGVFAGWLWLVIGRSVSPASSFALLPLVTLLVLPHAYAYDSVLLLLPLLAAALTPELQLRHWSGVASWALLYLASGWLAVFNFMTVVGVFPVLGLLFLAALAWQKHRNPVISVVNP